jgi:hypothetical protein
MSEQQARKKRRTPLEVLNDIPVAGKLLVLVLIPLGITLGVTLVLIINGLNRWSLTLPPGCRKNGLSPGIHPTPGRVECEAARAWRMTGCSE